MKNRQKPLLQKVIITLLLAAVLIGLLAILAYYQRPAGFTDSGLEAAVREKLDKPEGRILRYELLGIAELDASGFDIAALEGIERLVNLQALNLEDNFVEDLSPLRSLSNLASLNLRNNEITDLQAVNFEAVTELPLRYLSLRHNVYRPETGEQARLSDIGLLGELSGLENLELRDNRIEDIAPLSRLHNLQILDLRENNFTDLAPLAELKRLRELNLRDNDLNDLTPLAALTELTYLNIHSNKNAASLEPLAGLTKLEELIMANVPVGGRLAVIADMSELRRLNIRNCGIVDTAVLGDLMAGGALQDCTERGIEAVVDIRLNPLPEEGFDPYGPIRPYWPNISERKPDELPQ